MRLLFEDENEIVDVHLYKDETTGDVYYYNSELGKFVKIDIDTTDEERDQEDEEREKQAAQEREEDDNPEPEETEEERQKRLDRIKKMFDTGEDEEGNDIADELKNENEKNINKEYKKQARRAQAKKEVSSPIQRFSESIRHFLDRQLKIEKRKTWKKSNMSYEGSGIMRRGRMRKQTEHIPLINVYFDQSGSWGDKDIAIGMEAIGVLNNYVKRGEIEYKLYYFSNIITTDAAEARNNGGTGAGAELVYHIQSTKPDNVIIMTDDDISQTGHWNQITQAPKIRVPGAVWYLFRKYMSDALPEWIRGQKQTKSFII